MPIPELELAKVSRLLDAFCEKVPVAIRHELSHAYRVERTTVLLVERRARSSWHDLPACQEPDDDGIVVAIAKSATSADVVVAESASALVNSAEDRLGPQA